MNQVLKNKLIAIAEERQTKEDSSHDIQHVKRVTNLAIDIAESVTADLDIVIPAALFHDIVIYPKNSPQSKFENEESAVVAEEILSSLEEYPQKKISKVKTCITECSFSKGTEASSTESKVLQDADRLDATGAVSIMRTFASSGQMNRQFYDPDDPFCVEGPVSFRSGVDLFYERLLVVGERMHTELAREIAERRTEFLKQFLQSLKEDLRESRIID